MTRPTRRSRGNVLLPLAASIVLTTACMPAQSAGFSNGFAQLSFVDSEAAEPIRGGMARYSLRLEGSSEFRKQCRTGATTVSYMAIPLYVDRRTGAAIHPNTQLLTQLARGIAGAANEQVRVNFRLDDYGAFETTDTVVLAGCPSSPQSSIEVKCTVSWNTEGGVDCD
jgi:hypothetical protein